MDLYYLTLSTDAILIIIQQRAAFLALPINDLLSTHATVASVSVDLQSLIEEIVKSLLKLRIISHFSQHLFFMTHSLHSGFYKKPNQCFFKSWNISQEPGNEF